MAAAQRVAPSVDYGGYTWEVDRYEPDEFGGIGSFMGRDDVLRILIGEDGYAINRDMGFTPSFFDTQGRKVVLGLGAAPTYLSADLYVPNAWAAAESTDFQATGLWGTIADSSNIPFDYAIIGFSNKDDPGHFRIYNGSDYVTLPVPVDYNAWSTLRIEVLKDRYDYYVNGKLVYSNTNITKTDEAYVKELFLQSSNNNSSEYEIFYANVIAGLLMSSSDMQDVETDAGTPQAFGAYYLTQMVGEFASRRGMQPLATFVPQNDTWARTGGFTGRFPFNNGTTVDGRGAFIQGGVDVLEPFDGLSIGVTGQYGTTAVDGGGSNSSSSESAGLGLYVNYANDRYYVDAVSMANWEDWSVSSPSGSGTTNAFSLLASAESGVAIDIRPGLRVVPNAQLIYTSRHIDDLTLGGLTTSYDDQEQLVGRAGARLEVALPIARRARAYIGAAAFDVLADKGNGSISGVSLPGGGAVIATAGGADQLTADLTTGIDIQVTKHVRFFAQGGARLGGDTAIFQGNGGMAIKF